MKTIAEVVQEMSVENRLEIINNYDELVKTSVIGDCLMRKTAEDMIMEQYGSSQANITFWMMEIANECFRSFAREHISLKYK